MAVSSFRILLQLWASMGRRRWDMLNGNNFGIDYSNRLSEWRYRRRRRQKKEEMLRTAFVYRPLEKCVRFAIDFYNLYSIIISFLCIYSNQINQKFKNHQLRPTDAPKIINWGQQISQKSTKNPKIHQNFKNYQLRLINILNIHNQSQKIHQKFHI